MKLSNEAGVMTDDTPPPLYIYIYIYIYIYESCINQMQKMSHFKLSL